MKNNPTNNPEKNLLAQLLQLSDKAGWICFLKCLLFILLFSDMGIKVGSWAGQHLENCIWKNSWPITKLFLDKGALIFGPIDCWVIACLKSKFCSKIILKFLHMCSKISLCACTAPVSNNNNKKCYFASKIGFYSC